MKHSAGILLYKRQPLQVLLAHPGGPYWKNKDEHGWSVPKGEFEFDRENILSAAIREFYEETGTQLPENADYATLSPVVKSGKTFHFFYLLWEGELAPLHSNSFSLEWPPKSGKMQTFPEVDQIQWFGFPKALSKVHKGQMELLLEFQQKIKA